MRWLLLAVAASLSLAQDTSLQDLYRGHSWRELSEALRKPKGDPLYQAAVAAVFNEDQRAEMLLRRIIRSSPHSNDAYEAYEWLEHIYIRTGRYASLINVVDARKAAFPDKNNDVADTALFRGLPDQKTGPPRRSKLPHEPGEIFIPASINGLPATYFFDTGGMVSCMSESEAKRLGMEVHDTSGTIGNSAGGRVGLRTAVAREVTIGSIQYRNVSFAVFPDTQEPWSDLPAGRRGLIGLPLILGFHTLRWESGGGMEIGARPAKLDRRGANIAFDSDNLVVTAALGDAKVLATVDTGASSTDLYDNFRKQFPKLVSAQGRVDKTELHGVGQTDTVESTTLPKLEFMLGGTKVTLAPARVLATQIINPRVAGNFGMDLFRQAKAFKLDFGAMRLELEPFPPG